MMTAIIKDWSGGGASMAVLQLITRCLEVTLVYTHNHTPTRTLKTFTLLLSAKTPQKTDTFMWTDS